MPVEFLTDEQASPYGHFVVAPSRAELERCFLLDDVDRSLVMRRRGDANRLGFALQVGVVRLLGTFLTDLNTVPVVAVDYVAEDLGITDRSCLRGYAAREKTRLEHEWEIARVYGFREGLSAEPGISGDDKPAAGHQECRPRGGQHPASGAYNGVFATEERGPIAPIDHLGHNLGQERLKPDTGQGV